MRWLRKRRGAAFLIEAVLASIILMMVASGFAMVSSGQFSSLEGSKTALQAMQYADSKASEIGVTSYSSFTANSTYETRAAIGSTGFEREVIVGSEVDVGGGSKTKDVTVNIYKTGESTARFSLLKTLSSQGSGDYTGSLTTNGWTKLPNGLILQWGTRFQNDDATQVGRGYSVTFPIAFPNAFLGGSATTGNDSKDRSGQFYDPTTTGMTVQCVDKGEGGQNNTIYWTAIGY